MIQIGKKEFGISGFAIRLFAIIFMIIAVIGYEKGTGFGYLEAFAWTSFTLFAFLLVEGVAHSRNKYRYFTRFLLFTALGETIYTFYRTGTFWSKDFFSSMTSLFLGFLVLCICTYFRKKFDNIVVDIILIGGLGYGAYYLANLYNFDFGGFGIFIIMAFYVAREVTYTKITQAAAIFYISFFLASDVLTIVRIGGLQYPITPQLYSLVALPIIWLYNENRGPNSISTQLIQYLVYPIIVTCLILYRLFLA